MVVAYFARNHQFVSLRRNLVPPIILLVSPFDDSGAVHPVSIAISMQLTYSVMSRHRRAAPFRTHSPVLLEFILNIVLTVIVSEQYSLDLSLRRLGSGLLARSPFCCRMGG